MYQEEKAPLNSTNQGDFLIWMVVMKEPNQVINGNSALSPGPSPHPTLVPIFCGFWGRLIGSLSAFLSFFFTEEGRHGAVEWLLGGTKLRELKSDHYLTMEGKMRKTKTNKSVRTLEDCRLKNSQLFYQ